MLTVVFVFLIVGALYLYSTRTFDYWKKRGIKHDKPVPFFGTNTKGYFMQRSMSQLAADMYWKYPEERVVGFFRSSTPELIIRDPEIIKLILLSDFESFHLRGMFHYYDGTSEPLARHLFNADGDLWRLLRQRLTPAFTSVKLKAMFPLIVERAERLHVRIQAAAGGPIDARDLMARFTTDVIGACGFGLDLDTLSDDDSEFRKLGFKITNVTVIDAVKSLLKDAFPNTFKKLKLTARFEKEVLTNVKTILLQRNYEPSGRNDFIDLLLECKQKGVIVGESIEHFNPNGTPKRTSLEMTDDLMAAQAFVFFTAGFEPSSSTCSFTLHLLAYHPHIQKKVQNDIDRALAKHAGKFSYDTIKEMSYLEWALKESMRIFPSVGFLTRKCARKYKFTDLKLTIDKGVKIMIPVEAMQNDPQYFENPNEFRPERFDPKECDVEKIKCVYLPFGDGLRSCIGARLALMQSMAGLAAVLSKFTVEPAPSSVRYPHIETKPAIIQTIKGGLPLLFLERKK